MRLLSKLAILALFGAPALFALTCGGDTSGNGTLKGSYRFRNVIPLNYDTSGNVNEVVAASGVISFNGSGGYSMSGSYVDNTSNSGKVQTLPAIPTSASGCYAIGANGTGYIANPVLLALSGGGYLLYDYGAVSQGVFTGSMTEAGGAIASGGYYLADMFVAMPAGVPTTPSFNTPYWTGVLDFTAGLSTHLKNGMFSLAPNGAGGLGGFTLTGQDASQNNGAQLTQSSSGGTYSIASDGTTTLNITAPNGVSSVNQLFSGSKTAYVSADGSFLLGWSTSGYDIIFGVRALTQTASQSTFQGTYYTAALERGAQPFGCGVGTDAYSGSMSANADGQGAGIVHQRFWSPECFSGAYDATSDDYTQLNPDGTLAKPDFFGYRLAVGDGGAAFVGVSESTNFFSLVIGLQAQSTPTSGVYLSPLGIVNAGSWAPITAPLAPGELITLLGSGLAPATLVSAGGVSFPTNLGGVQVTINGILAPIYFVSSGQISVVMPYSPGTTGLAQIQVNNNGALSNTVTMYITDALAGIFTQNSDGLGYAIALHPDGSFVTKLHPAQTGEVLAIYLTGLGTVTPGVTDGSLGPSNPLSYSDEYTNGYDTNCDAKGAFIVFFNDYANNSFVSACVNYAGLAPGLAGLYQMNVVVPSGVGPGDVNVEVVTNAADVNQVQIPVGTGTAAAIPAFRTERPAGGRREPSHATPPRGFGRPRTPPQP